MIEAGPRPSWVAERMSGVSPHLCSPCHLRQSGPQPAQDCPSAATDSAPAAVTERLTVEEVDKRRIRELVRTGRKQDTWESFRREIEPG